MNFERKGIVFMLVLLLSNFKVAAKKIIFEDKDAGFALTTSGKISHGFGFGSNTALLNDVAQGYLGKVDKSFTFRTSFDWTLNFLHSEGVESQVSLRSKSVWGNSKQNKTTTESIKLQEPFIGSHSHDLEPRILYVREAWLKLNLDDLCGRSIGNQTVTVGSFGFQVGRGIAFGDAFAVNAKSLGFYSNSTVDMYAPGMKLAGNVWTESIKYNLYGSLSQNKSTSLSETTTQSYDQLIRNGGYVTSFSRGYGAVDANFISNLQIILFENEEKHMKFSLEPYTVFNYNALQKIDDEGDAKSKMATFGFGGELEYGRFELGFEGAFNKGHQDVYAWDRNKVTFQTNSTTGAIEQVYSHIYNEVGLTTKLAYTGDTSTYRPTSGISSTMNSAQIGATGKYNSATRFRDAYKNLYKGSMFVADASVYLYKRDFKVSLEGGYASGDVNPNTQKTGSERDYNGFVSFQEQYYGKRVKSLLLLNSLVRPTPLAESANYIPGIDGFSDIKYVGFGATYAPESSKRKLNITSNILAGWQDQSAFKFGSTTENASSSLGVELNTSMSLQLFKDVKFKTDVAFFFPGQFYTDLKGTALSSQVASLVKNAQAGVSETNSLPTLGDNSSFQIGTALEYSF
ncbi:hypothetical protein K9K77_02635 [Candidatus Babeliales bacterium]|nr:hypothetical protein [Candidatus Babeliales bacterium]